MIALLAAALALAPAPQDLSKVASISGMNGTCGKLVLAGEDVTARCQGKLLNPAYSNDYSSFLVIVGDEKLVSFYGQDHAAVGNSATLTVTKITTTLIGDEKPTPVMIDATGECSYTNPYAGPSHVECKATAGGKTYALSFVSDGKPPSVQRF